MSDSTVLFAIGLAVGVLFGALPFVMWIISEREIHGRTGQRKCPICRRNM